MYVTYLMGQEGRIKRDVVMVRLCRKSGERVISKQGLVILQGFLRVFFPQIDLHRQAAATVAMF